MQPSVLGGDSSVYRSKALSCKSLEYALFIWHAYLYRVDALCGKALRPDRLCQSAHLGQAPTL